MDEGETPAKRVRLESNDIEDAGEGDGNADSGVGGKFTIEGGDESTTMSAKKRIRNNSAETPGLVLNDQLREFQVLDEVRCDDDEGSGSAGGSGGETEQECDTSDMDMDENEIEALLDEGLPDDLKNKKRQLQYEEEFKTVLEEKGRNYFEVLPEGWVQVTHNSGIPLYLHKASRVCSVSRPYFLGPGSVRKHEIPLSAIPCLNYRKALERENEEKRNQSNNNSSSTNQQQSQLLSSNENSVECETISQSSNHSATDIATNNTTCSGGGNKPANIIVNGIEVPPLLPGAKIETVKENFQAYSLTASQINDYCQKLFKFKTVRVMRFKSWAARRKFTKNKKQIKNLQRPTLPDDTKVITFPVITPQGNNTTRPRKEWIMNPNGKSFVCILHEYVQHALKNIPSYEFRELENAATPYSATVTINGLKYGTGYGTSKKQAKSEAARETLEILIPEMKDKFKTDKNVGHGKNNFKDLSVFDEIKIEDPRVSEFSSKTTEPLPHTILLTCLQRNYGVGDISINYSVNTMKHKKNEFTMTVGKHTTTVVCKNKREGKQLASQAILQILHPHIKTWGSLLRLYGSHSIKSFKEKKQEEQEITVLQSKAAMNQPNYAILDKLKLEMHKLAESKAAVKPIGTFIPPSDVDLPCSSGSNLKNVDL